MLIEVENKKVNVYFLNEVINETNRSIPLFAREIDCL